MCEDTEVMHIVINQSLCFAEEILLVFFGIVNELQVVWEGLVFANKNSQVLNYQYLIRCWHHKSGFKFIYRDEVE